MATARFAKLKRWGSRTWLCFRIAASARLMDCAAVRMARRGRACVIRTDGRKEQLRSKDNRQLDAGDRVRIETPSGGGFGK